MRYSLLNCDQGIQDFIEYTSDQLAAAVGTNLIGVYLHGSLAMGEFNPNISDVDLLIVVRDPLAPAQRCAMARLVAADLSDRRPISGDLELSVILHEHARDPRIPMPFEVHYSAAHKQAILDSNVDYGKEPFDEDLVAHCATTRARGVILLGAPMHAAFGAVSKDLFMQSVLADFKWMTQSTRLTAHPVYAVLNMCRVIMVSQSISLEIVGKLEAGSWALSHLPEHFSPLIQQAMDHYDHDRPVAMLPADLRQFVHFCAMTLSANGYTV